jgi:hypothetical protein
MVRLCFPALSGNYKSDKSDFFIKLPNDSEIWFGGLDDKERVEKILGNEYATIYLNECSQIGASSRETVLTRLAQNVGLKLRCLYDCNPPSAVHWTHRLFVEKKRPEPPYSKLPDPDNYACLQMNPRDNAENLPSSYLIALQNLSPRAKQRFWEGQFGSANENALWTYEAIERNRVTKYPDLQRVVVAIDPSGASGEEDKRSDHIGIVVAGLGVDGHGYVIEDLTIRGAPHVWGRVAVTAYDRHQADAIVGETNYGGAMVEHVVKTAASAHNIEVSYKETTSTRGKVLRAEPISALYDQNRVHHYGSHAELEDQLCAFTSSGYMGDRSPDRADAMVFALSELFPGIVRGESKKWDDPLAGRSSSFSNWGEPSGGWMMG